MIDFLEKSSSMSSDALEINFGVRTEVDVSVVPSDVICIMCVVISEYFSSLWMIELEPIKPVSGVVFIRNGKYLNPTTGDSTVQLQRIYYLLCGMRS
jgi:hypothetical protein